MSWLVRYDVQSGREELNFSDWDRYRDKADDAVEMVREGEMPLARYTWIHRDAASTQAERDHLVDALMQMAGEDGDDHANSGPGGGG
jgi:Haem-binding domain